MPNWTVAEMTTGSGRRRTWRRSALGLLTLLVAAAALVACDPDSPDPSVVTLESNQLDAGGTGVVVSNGFDQLELERAVGDDGVIVPGGLSRRVERVGKSPTRGGS